MRSRPLVAAAAAALAAISAVLAIPAASHDLGRPALPVEISDQGVIAKLARSAFGDADVANPTAIAFFQRGRLAMVQVNATVPTGQTLAYEAYATSGVGRLALLDREGKYLEGKAGMQPGASYTFSRLGLTVTPNLPAVLGGYGRTTAPK
jgi:hypothetical protein